MSTHVTQEELDGLRRGALRPDAAAAIGRHTATCASCARAVAESLSFDRTIRDLQTQIDAEDFDHLSPDALSDYADGKHDAAAALHVDACESCRAEVAELQALQVRMRPRRSWVLYAIAASIATVVLFLALPARERHPPRPPHDTAPIPTPHALIAIAQPRYERAEWDEWVADAKVRGALAVPSVIEELRPRHTVLRGTPEEGDLQLHPDHAVVLATRPRLQWAAIEGATYNVLLRAGERVIESGAIEATHWTPPSDLARGREYEWQVEVTTSGSASLYPKAPAPPARFRVLDAASASDAEAARRAHANDPLLLAVVLAHHGLRDDALAEIARLGKSDPELARRLRASLEKWPK